MADFRDLFKRSVDTECASFEPSSELPQRIAQRTFQLQRRRRGRLIGALVVFTLAALSLPLVINPRLNDSTAVSVPFEPAKVNAAKNPDPSTTTNTATAASPPITLPDLSGLTPKEQAKAKKKFSEAKKRDDGGSRDPEVLGTQLTRGGTTADPRNPTTTTRRRPTTTTTRPTTTTTKPPATTTTTEPPTTTTTTTPLLTLSISGPEAVCAGVPTQYQATGTGAGVAVWSNLQVGPTATYTFLESGTVVAALDIPGNNLTRSISVTVIPAGTPPC